MKELKEIIRAEQNPNSLQVLLQKPKQLTDEISIYSGKLTTQGMISGISIIQKSFPALPISFYEVFKERIKANGFTDERLMDAIMHVVDTCHYPTPTIAQFVSFDKRFKILKYEDLLRKADEMGQEVLKKYHPVRLPDRKKLVWVHIDDIKQNNLEIYKPKTQRNET